MKFGRKLLSLATAGLVLSASLVGCSGSETQPTSAPLPEGVPEDVIMEVAGIAKDTPLITVNGVDVPAEELLYWVSAAADQYASYGMDDFSMDMGDGQTLGDYYLDSAVETATLYRVVSTRAEELEMGWNEEDQASYEESLQLMKESIAAQAGLSTAQTGELTDPELEAKVEAQYIRFLAQIGMSEDSFFHINQVSYYFQHLRDGLFGAEGTDAPDADKIAAAGVLGAKHILIKAVASEDGTDDGMAAALEQATGLYDQIAMSSAAAALFDELRLAHSQDVDAAGNVNDGTEGYTFGPNEMVVTFEEGTAALAVGEISQPIQSEFGYHIILRLDADNEAGRTKYADVKIEQQVEQWVEEAQVERTEALESIDLQAYYEKLGETRQAISDAAQAEFAPAGTATIPPTATPVG